MIVEKTKQAFLEALKAWVCDDYSIDIRFLAEVDNEDIWLWNASISLFPLPANQDLRFQIESTDFMLGQVQRFNEKKESLIAFLGKAVNGVLALSDKELKLPGAPPHDNYSEMSHRERWFSELHLLITGKRRQIPSASKLMMIDNALRASNPPFDGLADVALTLRLVAPGTSSNPPSIDIRVSPPVDLILNKCSLSNNRLHLILHAHPKFDVSCVGIAVRALPGNGLDTRKQVSSEINWGPVQDDRREGTAQIEIPQADNVLVMLMIGNSTVRRHWFRDPAKSQNSRLLAIQHFDKDLKMIRRALFDSLDSPKFEQGVAALLFLLGFSPSIQVEKDSPDIIVTTPGGRLVIVECTMGIKDFATKIGKLVDRRGALSKSLVTCGHQAPIYAALVCRLPRDQIAAHEEEVREHNIMLVTGEGLAAFFDQVRFPMDPDQMLEEAIKRLGSNANRGSEN